MRHHSKSQKLKENLIIIGSLLVILSIPIVTIGLANLNSLDPRSQAQSTEELPPCSFRFIYVDPQALEINKTVTLAITASAPSDEIISSIKLYASESGNQLENPIYSYNMDPTDTTNLTSSVTEEFSYTPTMTGSYNISGTMETLDGPETGYTCSLQNQPNTMEIVAENEPPEFTSSIPSTEQNNIKVGDEYSYIIEARDVDSGNSFGYAYSFSPGADWLNSSITSNTENNNSGTVRVELQGIADEPASYLVHMIIWDGYNWHTTSQSWVINVQTTENDIPQIEISKPAKDLSIEQGKTITIAWTGKDQNQIVKYQLYLATNPANKDTWIAINENIDPHVNRFIIHTDELEPGQYVAIIQAIDNQDPPLTGKQTSNKLTITKPKKEDSDSNNDNDNNTDDGLQRNEAQILNIQPPDQSIVNNPHTIVQATCVATKDSTVSTDSIKFLLNDKELTSSTELVKRSEAEINVVYTPENLENGEYKATVSFMDTDKHKAEKSWTFTVNKDENSNDMISIFGYKMSKHNAIIATIILVGIILLAIIIPWLLYLLFRRPNRDSKQSYYTQNNPPPSASDTGYYNASYSKKASSQPTYLPRVQARNNNDNDNFNDSSSTPRTISKTSYLTQEAGTNNQYTPISTSSSTKPYGYVENIPKSSTKSTSSTTPSTINDTTVTESKPKFNSIYSKPTSKTSLQHKSEVSSAPNSTTSSAPNSTTSSAPNSITSPTPNSTTSSAPNSTTSSAPNSTTSSAPIADSKPIKTFATTDNNSINSATSIQALAAEVKNIEKQSKTINTSATPTTKPTTSTTPVQQLPQKNQQFSVAPPTTV